MTFTSYQCSLIYTLLQAFLSEVDLKSQPTNGLTLKCCSNLAAQQKLAVGSPTNQQQLGELSATVRYFEPSSVIEVKVLAARNLRVERMCKWLTMERDLKNECICDN